jgi:putative endonuclease
MKEICAYILYSETLNKYYVGACQESIEERILKHNTGFYGLKTFTSNASDWILYLKIETQDYAHAIRIERKIKSMKSRVYIKNLKQYSELVEKVFNNTL